MNGIFNFNKRNPFDQTPRLLKTPISPENSTLDWNTFLKSPSRECNPRSFLRTKSECTGTKRCRLEKTTKIESPTHRKVPVMLSEKGFDIAQCEKWVHLIPSEPGKSDSIRRISGETLIKAINGEIEGIKTVKIVDCRFPFEFQGGHINNASNVNSFEELDSMFISTPPKDIQGSLAIVFHCEFSSHRAPAMAKHLRERDRCINLYPKILYPEVYILEGGYAEFFKNYSEHCSPQKYVSMGDKGFRTECKKEVSLRKGSLERSRSFCSKKK